MASPPLPFVLGLVERAAAQLGIRMVIEPRYRHSAQLTYADGRVRNVRGDRFDLNPSVAARSAQLRPLAAWLLAGAGIALPPGEYVLPHDHIAPDGTTHDRSKAPEFAEKLGYPLYAKTTSHLGRDWVRMVQAPEDLAPTLDALFRKEPAVYLQAVVAGRQIGAVVLDGLVRLAYGVDGGSKRLIRTDNLPEAVAATAARALEVCGLRYAAVDFICPPGDAAPVLLDIRTMPDLAALAALEPGGLREVESLVEAIVRAMGRAP